SFVSDEVALRGTSSLLVICNRELRNDNLGHWTKRWLDHEAAAVVGPERLGALLDARPRVQRRVPSLLGVRMLPATASTAWDGQAARALAPVFAPTRAYHAALDVLERHRFAVLTGPPEMGK